jgi:hypothetical protein
MTGHHNRRSWLPSLRERPPRTPSSPRLCLPALPACGVKKLSSVGGSDQSWARCAPRLGESSHPPAPGNPNCGCGSHARRVRSTVPTDRRNRPRVQGVSSSSLVDRAHAIAAMNAAARLSSRRERARRQQPTAAPAPASAAGRRLLGSDAGALLGFQVAGRRWRRWSAPRGRVAREVATGLGAETGAEQALRLRAQKLRPARADPARRRPQARDAQYGCDRGGRDAGSELQQLALDAQIAPARVLPRQPNDQAARRRPQPTRRSKQRTVSRVYRGRLPPRLKIATWWRKTTTSSSRSPPSRASRRTQTQGAGTANRSTRRAV